VPQEDTYRLHFYCTRFVDSVVGERYVVGRNTVVQSARSAAARESDQADDIVYLLPSTHGREQPIHRDII